jgi:hypothetical protein
MMKSNLETISSISGVLSSCSSHHPSLLSFQFSEMPLCMRFLSCCTHIAVFHVLMS